MTRLTRSSTLRALLRRLPVTGRYEARLEELTAEVHRLAAAGGAMTEHGGAALFAPPGHFYSPIVDVNRIRAREHVVWRRDPLDLPAVDLRVEAQWDLLESLAPIAASLDYSITRDDANERGHRYFTDNFAYGDGDGLVLGSMIGHFRPRRLVELGSGFSSACVLDARDRLLGGALDVTLLDPYPQLMLSLLHDGDLQGLRLLEMTTQEMPLSVVEALDENDILFIDSTHVCKTDSDVNRIFFEILPALKPGVVIHLHDIFQHFEYPPDWVYEGRSWNELYLLRAFLQYNDAFEILLHPTALHALDMDRYRRTMPRFVNGGGSFWMRKVC